MIAAFKGSVEFTEWFEGLLEYWSGKNRTPELPASWLLRRLHYLAEKEGYKEPHLDVERYSMATEKPSPMERLERLEIWARRSFIAMISCCVLLIIALHMIYAQISLVNYRGTIDARNATLDRENAEQNKVL